MDEDDYPINLGDEVYQNILDLHDEECERELTELTDEDLRYLQ